MPDNQTPASVLFDDLRRQAGLSNRDAARILLSTRPIYEGRSPRDRIEDRTFLSREVVHIRPENVNPSLYADFSQSAQNICARIVARFGGGDAAYAQVINYYSGDAMQRMAMVLNNYGRDGQIYINTVRRVRSAQLRRENDRAVLLVMAYVAVGCLADPRAAAAIVEQFTRRQLATDLVTMETSVGPSRTGAFMQQAPSNDSLGLVRVVDGAVKPPIHELSSGPQGTLIGSLPIEGSCITDVEVDVSRQHLVVWQQAGRWWCQGLESTNGTVLINGATKEIVTVELPRSARRGVAPKPIEIKPGDTLCLGLNTRFLVMRMRG